ncbi:MAG: helix-turn-helix transcriptional regulator [Oscillospiraceae bacterium]|nr:helix-turn-helix transcriptional regulator [Oscillospiraceae bacterium]
MENSFNSSLKRIRKEKGITQEQLADKVGVSPQAVSKWELSSYPDPQLLPSIADFLGVTIDELFGRAPEKEMSVHTRAMLELYDMPQSDDSSQKRLEYAYDLVRASIMGCCGCNFFGDIPDNVQNSTYDNHTLYLRDAGFIFGRLNANLPFMLVMPEPEKGYDDVLAYNKDYVELFNFLGMPNALRVMYFLAGRSTTIFFKIETLTNELGISRDNAKEIITKLLDFKFIWEATLDSGAKESEKIYQYLADYTLIPFLTFARTLLNRPNSFNYQTSWREKPFFKNDTYKEKKTDEKEK